MASYASATAAWSPTLSPDGARLAYCSDRDGEPRVWLFDRAGGTHAPLDGAPASVQRVSWSVDAEWLALLVAPRGSPRTQVWVCRVDGSGLREVGGSAQGATLLGPWTHAPGVLAVAETEPGGAAIVARLEHAETRRTRALASGGQPLVLDLDRQIGRASCRERVS